MCGLMYTTDLGTFILKFVISHQHLQDMTHRVVIHIQKPIKGSQSTILNHAQLEAQEVVHCFIQLQMSSE